MEHELSEQTRKRIAEHCRRIAVAQSLDEEIQRELAGHMEDKILGYLSGAERLSEEDAFVITRERFGDPALIKGLLGGVHAAPAAASLRRRALALGLMLNLYTLLASDLNAMILFAFNSHHTSPQLQFAMYGYLHPFLMTTLSAAFYWALFQRLKGWKGELAQGRRPWALRWPAWVAALALLATFCLRSPVTMLTDIQRLRLASANTMIIDAHYNLKPWVYLIVLAGLVALMVALAVLWLWWCDSAPRRPRAMLQATLWFVAYVFVGMQADNLITPMSTDVFNQQGLILFREHHWTYYIPAFTWANHRHDIILLIVATLLALFGLWIYEWAREKDDKQNTLTS